MIYRRYLSFLCPSPRKLEPGCRNVAFLEHFKNFVRICGCYRDQTRQPMRSPEHVVDSTRRLW
jgi:hypothetical protein